MGRYNYDLVADKWGTGGGMARSTFHSLTIHHSAVEAGNDKKYNAKARAQAYANAHRKTGYNNGIAYHFFIPRDESGNIYVTNYLTWFTNHNANYSANRDAIAILLDGNFQVEKPSLTQLKKLKQLLDDISANWFSKNGWVAFDKNINPQDNKTIKTYSSNKKVKILHWHNEVAQPGYATACPGNHLKPYISEYRDKKGNVKWGEVAAPPALTDREKEMLRLIKIQRPDVDRAYKSNAKSIRSKWFPGYGYYEYPKRVEAREKKIDELNTTIEEQKQIINEKNIKLGEARAAYNKLIENPIVKLVSLFINRKEK